MSAKVFANARTCPQETFQNRGAVLGKQQIIRESEKLLQKPPVMKPSAYQSY